MLHRWPSIRAYMGPEFIALLNWYAARSSALEAKAEDVRAWRGTEESLARTFRIRHTDYGDMLEDVYG